MVTAMIVIFILGYVFIALENKTGINKAAVALILGMFLWTLFIFSAASTVIQANATSFSEFLAAHKEYLSLSKPEQVIQYIVNLQIVDHLGNVAEILFYLLGAMTIVELMDIHKGFEGITRRITTRNKKKLLDKPQERWIFGSVVVIAANAGGAWTPIGDVTTIMLWINDNITSGDVIRSLFFPSVAALAFPLWIISLQLKGNVTPTADKSAGKNLNLVNRKESNIIFILGILCLLSVPIFKSLTHLPPFAGILLALGLLWVYMDIFYNRKKNLSPAQQFRLPYVLSKVDFPTILFFFGILMAVAALEAVGVLKDLSVFLDQDVHNVYIVSIIIGFLSSVIDNVPLVAASMGMYPVLSPQAAAAMPEPAYMANFVQDGTFWELIAYCAGTGGSILIIGSAAGVVVMGLEKINFMWYVKHISGWAIVGFLAGIGIYILQKLL